MEVFITGATGVLGKRVVKLLVENNLKVRALSRSEANENIIRSLGGIPVSGDLFNSDDMIKASEGCDIILHLATAIPKNGKPKAADWKMNDRIRTEGTYVLLEAARVNEIGFFLQQSIAFLYGNRNGETVTADMRIADKQPGMLNSAKTMEEIIQKSGVHYAIVRFGSFYSADSAQTKGQVEAVKKRKLPIIGKGDFYWNVIHVDDAASAILHILLNKERCQNKIINVSDFNPILFSDWVKAIASATGSKPPASIPKWIGRLVLGKDMFGVLTSSYKLVKEDVMKDWQPVYPDFREGIRTVVKA